MKVYVFVGEDRHVDDTIEVYRLLADANLRVRCWQDAYHGCYVWQDRKLPKLKNGEDGWIRDTHTNYDEGPKARIEQHELQ